jgi:D-amino peptidase
MEGATGVTARNEVTPGEPAYERFRRLLTADVNAAVQGAFDGGASEVWVNEAHDGMRNIVIEDLDPRAELIVGVHKPFPMMCGIDDCDLTYFVAYHARAGQPGVLAHTFWDGFAVEINGEQCSEARINAALAGERGVAVALVTGDDLICSEAASLFPGVRTAVVKHAIDNFSARCLVPRKSATLIRAAAQAGVENEEALIPFVLEPPLTVRIQVREPSQAGVVTSLAGVTREGPTTVGFVSESVRAAYGLLEAIGTISSTVGP